MDTILMITIALAYLGFVALSKVAVKIFTQSRYFKNIIEESEKI